MEFEGIVLKKLPATSGTSARGEWQRQDVIFEMPREFNRKVCVTFFNRPTDAESLREGQTYIVSVNIESREFNGKWYTDVRAWRVQPKQAEAAAEASMPDDMPPFGGDSYSSYSAPAAPAAPVAPMNEVDDLPF
jgi:hypothetical protein